jgi:hypothetical protein
VTTPLSRAALESAEFWDETVCLDCGTIQTGTAEVGAPCEECESADTTKASKLVAFLNLLENEDAL